MKRLIILITALMLITTGCHKDESEPRHHIVTYYGNGGLTASGESSVKDVKLGVSYYLKDNMFTNENKEFKCWNTKLDGNGNTYHPNAALHVEELNLYAIWLNKYTITFNANGGTGTMNPQTVTDGETVNLHANTFTRNGYYFECWNTKANGSGTSYWDNSSVTLHNNLILYAQWGETPTNILMCNGSLQLSSGKTYHFYDSGGSNGYYSNYEDYTYTFKAPSGKRVKIVFNDFSTESRYDYLTINGTSYSGSSSPGTKYSSGSNLTVQWHSDGSINYPGWSATVTVVN